MNERPSLLYRLRIPLLLILLVILAGLVVFYFYGSDECRHLVTKDTTVEPDCSRQGYVLHECRSCGYTYKSDFVEPYGHTIVTETVAPTCAEQGYTTYACECGYTYTSDYVAPLDHDLAATVTEPTCEEPGYTSYICANGCGYAYDSHLIAPLGHELTSVYNAATCTTGSYTRYLCARCEMDYKSAVSEPLGHTFTDTVVYPSIARTGYTEHVCHCGYSYTDSYVWYSDIFTGSAANSSKPLATGIDISYYQKSVDWDKLKATGIDYVILRAAYYPKGSYSPKVDPKFEEYYAAAKAAGLDVGCYLYSMATSVEEAREEAIFLADLLEGKTFEYPIYFDLEDPLLEYIDTEVLMDMCLAFCQTLSDGGYFPAMYTNNRWLINFWHKEQVITLYDVWYARYPRDDDGETYFPYGTWTYVPDYAGDYGMWQYTEYGTIDGISGRVDLNICYKDYPSLIKKYGYNGFAAE